MISAYLEVTDVVAIRVGDMLVLCHEIHKLSIASLAVIVQGAIDQVLKDRCMVLEPTAAWSAILHAIAISVASVKYEYVCNGNEL
jgi:hypothetical protein